MSNDDAFDIPAQRERIRAEAARQNEEAKREAELKAQAAAAQEQQRLQQAAKLEPLIRRFLEIMRAHGNPGMFKASTYKEGLFAHRKRIFEPGWFVGEYQHSVYYDGSDHDTTSQLFLHAEDGRVYFSNNSDRKSHPYLLGTNPDIDKSIARSIAEILENLKIPW